MDLCAQIPGQSGTALLMQPHLPAQGGCSEQQGWKLSLRTTVALKNRQIRVPPGQSGSFRHFISKKSVQMNVTGSSGLSWEEFGVVVLFGVPS